MRDISKLWIKILVMMILMVGIAYVMGRKNTRVVHHEDCNEDYVKYCRGVCMYMYLAGHMKGAGRNKPYSVEQITNMKHEMSWVYMGINIGTNRYKDVEWLIDNIHPW